MPEKEFQRKIKFLLFVQIGLNQSDLSYEQAIDAIMQADFVPAAKVPNGHKTAIMAIEFVSWQVTQANTPDWDYKKGQLDWYKNEWIVEN